MDFSHEEVVCVYPEMAFLGLGVVYGRLQMTCENLEIIYGDL